jgi:hypothetical protein
MRYLILSLLIFINSAYSDEILNFFVDVNLNWQEIITVDEGKTLQLDTVSGNGSVSVGIGLIPHDSSLTLSEINFENWRTLGGWDDLERDQKINGPVKVVLRAGANPATLHYISFKRFNTFSTNSSEASSSSLIPSNAVVIPSDASGPVEIILESSTDMVNWNSALPGTYGASTEERFFRVRAVRE